MSDEMIPVGLNEPMGFNCSPENPCFNDCCRDLNQALTPYDIFRMKQNLGIRSQKFLREFTSRHHGPGSGLPIITFKPNPATGHACPFVGDQGCTLYQDRPASCRMYPLARAIARDRATGKIREYYARIEEEHCLGSGKGGELTVGQWLDSQDVAVHNQENDKLMELIALKNQIRPGRLEGAEADQFYMALYDLDEFRDQILNHGLLEGADLPVADRDKITANDLALLNFGIAWIKHMLFGHELKVGA